MVALANEKGIQAETLRTFSVVVVGTCRLALKIQRELRSSGFSVLVRHNVQEALAASEANTARGIGTDSIILVDPSTEPNVARLTKTVEQVKVHSNLPVFAVVPSWTEPELERSFYGAGVRLIFEWPKEKNSLARKLRNIISASSVSVAADTPDVALEGAVINSVRAENAELAQNLRVTVFNSVVFVKGTVENISGRAQLREILMQTPGVRDVIVESVAVAAEPVDDFVLARQIYDLITNSLVDCRTIDVEVESGLAVVRGSVHSYDEVRKIEREIEKVYGVRDVDIKIIISPLQYLKDAAIAYRFERELRTVGRLEKVRFAVCGTKVILRGQTASLISSTQLENLAFFTPGVSEVVNHLEIKSGNV